MKPNKDVLGKSIGYERLLERREQSRDMMADRAYTKVVQKILGLKLKEEP